MCWSVLVKILNCKGVVEFFFFVDYEFINNGIAAAILLLSLL